MKSLYYKLRGCGWDNRARYCRLASRNSSVPGRRSDNLGFRIFQEYK
jgi:formylglycine-generating enzyme required for sulfatase activity